MKEFQRRDLETEWELETEDTSRQGFTYSLVMSRRERLRLPILGNINY